MLSPDDATALVAASRLFDERWYAELAGVAFDSREAAVRHWVAQRAPEASPHPLVEPAWLYPGGRWRDHAPDPLSFYLSRPEARGRSPHPRYRPGEAGPLEEWLAEHDPAELLPAAVPRAEVGALVIDLPDDLARAVRWLRRLPAEPGATVVVRGGDGGRRRVLEALAADRPEVRLDPVSPPDGVRVLIGDPVEPPAWPWLGPLLAHLDTPGVAAAQPVLLADDFTVAAPVLVGHPVSALERLDGVELPAPFDGVLARRVGAEGRSVLAAHSWLPATIEPLPAAPWSDLEGQGRRARVVEGRPSLRWAIDVAAGAAPIGRRWGDWHFARSLADALERLGQWVEIDHPETRGRATRVGTDVVLTLRGLERVAPQPGACNLLWVISHPDDVTRDEVAAFDAAFAAGTAWAAARDGVTALLQCTDTTRFHPGAVTPDDAGGALFVGNARGGMRPALAAAREAGLDVRVIGTGWASHGVSVVTEAIANTDLPEAYASAGVVLNDHWADMAAQGFVSNRVFDVLAVGGRLLTDDVVGLADALGETLPVWRTPADLARLATPPYDGLPDAAARARLAERVVAEHSFDARAATLLDAALHHAASARRGS